MLPLDSARHIVTAVVVTHDGARWLPETLEAVRSQTRPVQRIIGVDTGSRDRSGAILAEYINPEAILTLPRNTSYGGAVQEALDHPRSRSRLSESEGTVEWIWLVHDDCTPEPDALEQLLAAADDDPRAAVLGPKLRDWFDRRLLLEVGVTIDGAGRRETGLETSEYDHGQHDGTRQVLAVSSAGMLVRRDVWEALGGFDRSLRLFRDDIDFCWRVGGAGHRVLVVTEAVAYHAEAAARRRRRIHATGDHPRRVDRRNALYVLLANLPAGAMLGALLRNSFASALRVLTYLVAKQPANALDEAAAITSVFFVMPFRLIRARIRRRRGRRRTYSAIRPFMARGVALRQFTEVVANLLSGDPPSLDTAGRHQAVTVTPQVDDDDPLRDDLGPAAPGDHQPRRPAGRRTDRGRPRRRTLPPARRPARRRRPAARVGRRLRPVGDVPGELARRRRRHRRHGPALRRRARPAVHPGPGQAVAGGHRRPGRLRAAGRIHRLPAGPQGPALPPRPTVDGGLLRAAARGHRGDLPGTHRHRPGPRALPGAGTAGHERPHPQPARRSRRAAWALGLVLALLMAFVPLVWVLALLSGVLIAVAFGHVGRRLHVSLAVSLVTPLVLLLPWTLELFLHPSLWLLEAGINRSDTVDARLPAEALLLLSPGGPGTPPIWVTAGFVAAALCALLLRRNRMLVAVGWCVALIGVLIAIAVSRLPLNLASGEDATAWPGVALAFASTAMLLSAATAAQSFSDLWRLGWHRRLFAATVALLALTTPVTAAGLWMWHGVQGPLTGDAPPSLPPFLESVSADGTQPRTLVVSPRDDGTVSYAVLRGRPPRLGEPQITPDPDVDARLGEVVAAMVAGRGGDEADALADFGIRYLLVPAPEVGDTVDRTLVDTVDALPGLERLQLTEEFALWRLLEETGRLRIASSGEEEPTVLQSGPVDAEVEIPPGTGGRRLLLAEPAGSGWQATLNGVALTGSRTEWGMQEFELPAQGGRLVLTHTEPARQIWLGVQAVLVLVVVALALPGARTEEDLREQATQPTLRPRRPGGRRAAEGTRRAGRGRRGRRRTRQRGGSSR
ncbi:GT2 family glycosyltransferase [Thermobifida halotolerans]|uniref:glycosyltransferase n=1 Tax=Thermobifida halotolerans TaxID=483545 RepID=UPI003513E086